MIPLRETGIDMIGDTSFFIDLMRSDPGAIEAALFHEKKGKPVCLTTVTVFELRVGVSMGQREEAEKAQMYSILEGLPVYPLDMQASIEGGRIYSVKSKQGMNMDIEDAMIAGIAKVRNEGILTRYVKLFSGIDGVKVQSY